MSEDEFWKLIGQLNWKRTGNDDAVIRPVVKALARLHEEQIIAFDDLLAEKLHALDTERHAREIGSEAFTGDRNHFSEDWFLYARCCVVANGKDFYETILHNPSEMPKDMEFEALLEIAARAYEEKTDQPYEHIPTINYETYSNLSGWPNA